MKRIIDAILYTVAAAIACVGVIVTLPALPALMLWKLFQRKPIDSGKRLAYKAHRNEHIDRN